MAETAIEVESVNEKENSFTGRDRFKSAFRFYWTMSTKVKVVDPAPSTFNLNQLQLSRVLREGKDVKVRWRADGEKRIAVELLMLSVD